MTNVQIALCTIDSQEAAETLARSLLERRCVACVNVVPGIQSMYWWQGAVETAAEVLLILKTTRDKVDALKAALRELHPYDTPELLCLGVDAGLEDYLAWVGKETRR